MKWSFLLCLVCFLVEQAVAFRAFTGLRLPVARKSAVSVAMPPLRSTLLDEQPPTTAVASSSSPSSPSSSPATATVTVVIPSSDASSYFAVKPFGDFVPWSEAFEHIQEKLRWEPINNPAEMANLADLTINVVTLDEAVAAARRGAVSVPGGVVLLVNLDLDADADADVGDALTRYCTAAAAVATFGCLGAACAAVERYGDYQPAAPLTGLLARWDAVTKSRRFRDRGMRDIAQELWQRKSTGDLLFMVLVLVDYFTDLSVKTVKSVTSSENTSFGQAYCMCTKCTKEIAAFMQNENCRKALKCLESCRGNDQVCSYRCIVSYETAEFENFARCILQRNNCMGNTATAPVYPDPAPLASFRGATLTHDTAEAIFEGWLRPRDGEANALVPDSASELRPWSWMVVCGQNPAYDYFSCQHQLFYKDKARKSVMWYDPVFRVTTLDGIDVWRRRHYRVRRGKVPGQFYFSVLDNGVTSSEYWRIVDAADDLSWAVFYYSGAAVAAGTSYTGALVVTRDGRWPDMARGSETFARISSAMAQGGIKMWELFQVTNTCCDGPGPGGPPPLEIE